MTETCPVVGIGVSAGGLDALEAFFDGVAADTGAAFVVIQHLDPAHASMTAEILGRHTSMPAVQVQDGMKVEPNHVYVIPPNAYLTLAGDSFALGEAVLRHGLRMPIDAFFRSLAEGRGERGVAMIATGTGADGALGLRAVKEAGGVVLAQDPKEAQFDGMPRAAIATGLVDVVCPIAEMAGHITRYLSHRYIEEASGEAPPASASDDAGLRPILALLLNRVGHDFRSYKQGTLQRRVARRMGLLHIDRMRDYLAYLENDEEEPQKLFRDLLISVTSFFRDPDAFAALDKQVITPLIAAKPDDEPIRIWAPGCASGEEAYSIAMLVIERLAEAQKHCPVQVFATDIDEDALSIARNGVYSETLVAELSPERLRAFFVKEDHVFRVGKHLRDSVTFAVQNVITDPPFSRIDLISCRNLLIYLTPEVQSRVLGYFHFALREGGCLFLGASETVSQQEKLFEALDKKLRIFRRVAAGSPAAAIFPIGAASGRHVAARPAPPAGPAEQLRLRDLIQQRLLQSFAPAAVLINGRHQILYYSGPTATYLEQPMGAPTQDLLALANTDLRATLRAGLRRAAAEDRLVTVGTVQVRRGAERAEVRITISRMHLPGEPSPMFLVTFEDQAPAEPSAALPASEAQDEPSTVHELERELSAAREDLQSNIEELEAANEELQAANEEVMSINEELQSTNEEMETSKEELQSMNEELTTVNSQLKDKVEQLASLNDDLSNFVASSGVATLFLDRRNRIGRFTPATKNLFNLIATDAGRPLGDIRPKFEDEHLMPDIEQVLEKLQPVEREIVTEDGAWHLRRILPYRTSEDRIDGVVITFFEITKRVMAEQRLRQSESRFRMLLEGAPDPMVIVDAAGAITFANAQAERFFGYAQKEMLGMPVDGLVPARLRSLHRTHRETFLQSPEARQMGAASELHALTRSGEEIPVEISLSPIDAGDGMLVCAAIRDIRDRRRTEAALRLAKGESDSALAAKSRFLATASHDLRQPLQSLVMLNEALLRLTSNREAHRLIETQQQSLDGMRVLLNSLLDISKLEAGTVTVEIADVALHSILAHLANEFEAEARRKGLEIFCEDQGCVARTDPQLLTRLLQNLVANAIRYTEKGFVRIDCVRDGDAVRVTVSDSGPGIPAAEISRIFEEFYLVDRDPHRRDGGLGLGLAIVRRLADLIDAQVEVSSEPDEGSVFSVVLPVGEGEPTVAQRVPETQLPRVEGGSILVVDDDEVVLESVRLLLSLEEGLDVTGATTPEAAYASAEAVRPDLIVADMHLNAAESGLDVIASIRKRVGREIPAVLLSGDTSLTMEANRPPSVHVVTKPTDGNDLIETIWRLLRHQLRKDIGEE